MGFFSRLFERRAVRLQPGVTWQDFGVGPTASSVVVTSEKAVGLPAVHTSIEVLAQDLARTPIVLKRKIAEDSYEAAPDHDLYEVLHDLSNPEMTAYQTKHHLMRQLLIHSRAYAEIVRVDGRVVSLWPLDSDRMRVDRTPERRKRYTYSAPDGRNYTWLFDPSMPPILELHYDSPLARCRELIGLALALQTYQGRFFATGGAIQGVLKTPGVATQDVVDRLRDRWNATFGKLEGGRGTPILDGGLDYQALTSSNTDAQLYELNNAIMQAIAATFRLPPWKVGIMAQTTYSNMSAGELAYITSTLDPLYELWEQAIARDLLTTRQFGSFKVEFDRRALLRNDLQTLNTMLASGIEHGYLSQNDARRQLGLNPIADGDTYRLNSALVPVDAQTGLPRVA